MRTDVVVPYRPRTYQRLIHDRMAGGVRFAVVVCHRRFGKTVLAVNELQRGAVTCRKPRPRFAYIGPTYRQGKAVAWDYMQHYARPVPGVEMNQSELRVDYPNEGQSRIYGADNPDSLRGIYLDGVDLDEYGMHPAKTFSEVVAATLVDRGGWALFTGTPNGRNQFYEIAQKARERQAAADPLWAYFEFKASETGLLDAEYLRQAREVMTADEYAQEFECSFEAAVKGSIYSAELQRARDDKRITSVPYDPVLPVDTTWDLGVGDAMSIWFSQSTKGGEVRLIDYYEGSGEGFPFYAAVLKSKGYVYGQHWAPHDVQVREMSSGRSRLEVAEQMGIRFSVTPRLQMGSGEVEEGIHAARMLFPRCWFDAEKCKAGLEALQHYRRDYNERMNEFKATPVHDWACFTPDTKVLMRSGTHPAQSIAIMDLPTNGEVMTPCGWKRYEGPRITRRNASLVEVEFVGGHTVRCTPDHLFATGLGWKSAESLTPGSLILSCSTLSASTSTAGSIASGLRSAISRAAASAFTAMFGAQPSGLSLAGATSTTGTGTPVITALPTWNAYRPPSTFAHLQPSGRPSHSALPQGPLPRSGTDPTPAGPGIGATQSALRGGRSGSERIGLASTAARSFGTLWSAVAGMLRSTAPTHARPLRIARVTPLSERADTCCIHVRDVECFSLENGAIVHNSHGSDAFRYLAVWHQIPRERKQAAAAQMPRTWSWT